MTKSELIKTIADKGDLTKEASEKLVNFVFDSFSEAILREERIELRGFGAFTVKHHKPYLGRNPKTGEPVQVTAKKSISFKVGKELKERVNNL